VRAGAFGLASEAAHAFGASAAVGASTRGDIFFGAAAFGASTAAVFGACTAAAAEAACTGPAFGGARASFQWCGREAPRARGDADLCLRRR
jgi:hypothetical protein